MRKSLTILLASLLLSVGTALASKVTGINISHDEEFTITEIDVEGDVRFTHQTEIAKDGKPFRIIVDILAATHEMGAKKFVNLPDCKLTGIRSSQYAVDPENIVRVVFDMKSETAYRVDADEHSVKIYVYDPDAGQFPIWSSYDVINGEDTSTSITSTVETPIAESTATQIIPAANDPASIIAAINQALDEDRQSSLEAADNEEKPKSSKTAETPDTNAKAHSTETTVSKPIFGQDEFGSVVGAESTASQVSDSGAPKTAAQILEEINRATALSFESLKTEPTPVVGSGQKGAPGATPAETASSTVTAETTSTTTDNQIDHPVSKPEPVQPGKNIEEGKDTDDGGKSVTGPVKKTLLPQTPNKTVPGNLAEMSVETGTIVDAETDEQSTARFRRDPSKSKRIRGTLVAEFPTRLLIKYKGSTYRDPFETLINDTKVQHNPMEQRVPNVEGLRLVGILETFDEGNRALFEDNDAYGYILKAGDKVQKGYVLRVDEDRVYFQIFEYGWSRTVALDMEIF